MKRFILISLFFLASCSDRQGAISLRRGDPMCRNIKRETVPVAGGFYGPGSDSLGLNDSLAAPPAFEEPEIPPRIYACGVENPDSDSPVFAVFEDGLRLFDYTLGANAVDADKHFLIGPDMYIALTEGQETVVYKNGVREFSFKAREYIGTMIKRKDGLWTLGISREGDGFALRKNGEAVCSKSSGIPGRLYLDEDHLYFDYSLSVGGKTLRYLVKDGDDFALTSPFGGTLLAVTVSGGEIWYLESSGDGWVLSCGEKLMRYDGRIGFGFRSAELYGAGGECEVVVNMVAQAYGMPAELVCEGDEQWLKGGGSGSYHYFDCKPSVHITFTRNMEQLSVCGFGGAGEERIEGVRFESERCAMQYGGQIYLAFSSTDGSPPFIWKRGNSRMALDFNGYLTGIYVEAQD